MAMNRFEWMQRPHGRRSRRGAASTTVAEAMLACTATAPASPADVLKAGGIDLLDLMKEGLLAPRRVVNLRGIPGLDLIAEDGGGGLRIGALATLEQVAADPLIAAALCGAGRGGGRVGQPADPRTSRRWAATCCNGRAAGTSAPTRIAACARAAAAASPSTARTSTTPSSPMRSAPSCIPRRRRPRWWRSRRGIEIVNAEGETRRPLLDEFFVAPETDVQRENDLKPGEVADRRAAAAARPRAHVRRTCAESDKQSFDWPIADVAVVLERDADGRCRRAAVVLGAAAPVPRRARATEELLAGEAIDETLARAAGQAALEASTPLGQEPPQAADLCRAGAPRPAARRRPGMRRRASCCLDALSISGSWRPPASLRRRPRRRRRTEDDRSAAALEEWRQAAGRRRCGRGARPASSPTGRCRSRCCRTCCGRPTASTGRPAPTAPCRRGATPSRARSMSPPPMARGAMTRGAHRLTQVLADDVRAQTGVQDFVGTRAARPGLCRRRRPAGGRVGRRQAALGLHRHRLHRPERLPVLRVRGVGDGVPRLARPGPTGANA